MNLPPRRKIPSVIYLSVHPTNVRIWHKAVFLGGSGRKEEAYTRPAKPKIHSASSALPFFGAPQAPSNTLEPQKE